MIRVVRNSVLLVAAIALLIFSSSVTFAQTTQPDTQPDTQPTIIPSNAPMVTFSYGNGGKAGTDPIKLGIFLIGRLRGTQFTTVTPELLGVRFSHRWARNTTPLTFDAPAGATVYMLIDSDAGAHAADKAVIDLHQTLVNSGWSRLPIETLIGQPVRKNYFTVYKQTFSAAVHVVIPAF